MKEKELWESRFYFPIVGFALGRRKSMNANQNQIKKKYLVDCMQSVTVTI